MPMKRRKKLKLNKSPNSLLTINKKLSLTNRNLLEANLKLVIEIDELKKKIASLEKS